MVCLLLETGVSDGQASNIQFPGYCRRRGEDVFFCLICLLVMFDGRGREKRRSEVKWMGDVGNDVVLLRGKHVARANGRRSHVSGRT